MLQYLSKQYNSRLIKNIGSTESQILLLTKRVIELTTHLKKHKSDYASIRGLKKILGKRKRLLFYLNQKDLWKYNKMVQFLKK
jgi:small subunit ribosomal protein S15